MCPVKTENISFNASRAEGDFWRKLEVDLHMKSRGELHKYLLAVGLAAVNRHAARQLTTLRGYAVSITHHGRKLVKTVPLLKNKF
ncbi:MAG: hypothetical protein WCS94_14200 [Verrucomicrobiota bacterium]